MREIEARPSAQNFPSAGQQTICLKRSRQAPAGRRRLLAPLATLAPPASLSALLNSGTAETETVKATGRVAVEAIRRAHVASDEEPRSAAEDTVRANGSCVNPGRAIRW